MTYVTAGIYGDWNKYNKLLQTINLKDTDTLYVIGDVADYGEQGMEVLTDMSMRANIYPVAGEHDFFYLLGFERRYRHTHGKVGFADAPHLHGIGQLNFSARTRRETVYNIENVRGEKNSSEY